jgi:hypothetical protein
MDRWPCPCRSMPGNRCRARCSWTREAAHRSSGHRTAASGSAWPQAATMSWSPGAPHRARLTLPLPLRPHRVEVRAEGWAVEGVREDGAPEGQLQFTRLGTGAQLPDLETGALPGFARVDRLLRLGLDWRVDTEVRRLSPLGQALVLKVSTHPLLSECPVRRLAYDPPWVRSATVSITPCAKASSPRWNASCWTAAASRPRPRRR